MFKLNFSGEQAVFAQVQGSMAIVTINRSAQRAFCMEER